MTCPPTGPVLRARPPQNEELLPVINNQEQEGKVADLVWKFSILLDILIDVVIYFLHPIQC
jgi:hypothetical protein